MNKVITTIIAVLFLIPIFTITTHYTLAGAPDNKADTVKVSLDTDTSSADDNQADGMDIEQGAMKVRLTQLLNLNRVYDEFINDDLALIEEAGITLIDQADEIDGIKMIKKAGVLAFIKDLYGKEVDGNTAVYENFPAPEGYFAILPRGFSGLSHTITGMSMTDEGKIAVVSVMTVDPHDNDSIDLLVESVFKVSEGSAFGYNLVSADIIE